MSNRQDHVREAIKTAEAAFARSIEKTRLMMKNKVWGSPISDNSYAEHVDGVRTYINGGSNCGQGLASRLLYSETSVINSVLDEAIAAPIFHNALSGNLIKAYVRSFRDAFAKIEPEFAAYTAKHHHVGTLTQ